jgi:hypothetical protein
MTALQIIPIIVQNFQDLLLKYCKYLSGKTMTSNLTAIAQYLNQKDWNYKLDSVNNCIYTAIETPNVQRIGIIIDEMENGAYLRLVIPQLFHVKDSLHKGTFFQTLLTIQGEMKLINFTYNPVDGEIEACVELLLENVTLTQELFDRALGILIEVVYMVAIPRLKAVLATGEDPGGKQMAQIFLELLPPEMLTMLEQALESRRNRQ